MPSSSSSSGGAAPPPPRPVASSSSSAAAASAAAAATAPAAAKSLFRSIAEPISDLFGRRRFESFPEEEEEEDRRRFFARRSVLLGETWSSVDARRAYESTKTLRSSADGAGGKVRVAFRNATAVPLVLCWVSGNGGLHHYYRLDPPPPPPHPVERAAPSPVESSVTKDDHVETTCLGHAFLVAVDGDGDDEEEVEDDGGTTKTTTTTDGGAGPDGRDDVDVDGGRCFDCFAPGAVPASAETGERGRRRRTSSKRKRVDPRDVVGGYRPTSLGVGGVVVVPSSSSPDGTTEDGFERVVHVVTFSRRRRRRRRNRRIGTFWGAKRTEPLSPPPGDDGDGRDDQDDWIYETTVSLAVLDRTPHDTSSKLYEATTLGGWPARCEPGWDLCRRRRRSSSSGDDEDEDEDDVPKSLELRNRIESDLKAASDLLPPHARDQLLRSGTAVYVNRSQKFGPKISPVVGRGMCYHPDVEWLTENGMSTDKAGCVELYDAGRYLDDCDLWGRGGVMLHELCHAYHAKCTPDGYDNEDIRKCYERAMTDGLYDEVRVHCRRTKGGTTKERVCHAYACTDPMEYFAELSVAFLGGKGKKKGEDEEEDEEEEEEFNKWYPFNRSQVKEHDPRAYELLKRMWKVDDEEE